jgi:hypothetical protein
MDDDGDLGGLGQSSLFVSPRDGGGRAGGGGGDSAAVEVISLDDDDDVSLTQHDCDGGAQSRPLGVLGRQVTRSLCQEREDDWKSGKKISALVLGSSKDLGSPPADGMTGGVSVAAGLSDDKAAPNRDAAAEFALVYRAIVGSAEETLVVRADQMQFRIGRGTDNDYKVVDSQKFLSRQHCILSRADGNWTLANNGKRALFVVAAEREAGACAEVEMVEPGKRLGRPLRRGDIIKLVFCAASNSTSAAGGYSDASGGSGGTAEYRHLFEVVQGHASPPVLSHNGGSFEGFVDVALRCATIGAMIRYTLDGSCPGPDSPVANVASAAAGGCTEALVEIRRTGTVVRAVAYARGWLPSAELRSTPFRMRAPRPVFEPDGGDFNGPVAVVVRCAPASAAHCTVDGTPATRGAPRYGAGEKIMVDQGGGRLRAVAVAEGLDDSEEAVSAEFRSCSSPNTCAARLQCCPPLAPARGARRTTQHADGCIALLQ